MRIELSFRVTADGLAGGDAEFEPYLGVRASFGSYRTPTRVALVQQPTAPTQYVSQGVVGPFVLDHVERDFRGDESFWIEMRSRTRLSGIEDIDKLEKDYVARDVNSGTLQLPLGKLLAAVNPATGVGAVEHEDMITSELLTHILMTERQQTAQPNVKRAVEAAHKAWVGVDVRVLDASPPALKALTAALMTPLSANEGEPAYVRNGKTGALLYVPANYGKFAAALDYFVGLYAERYIGHIDAKTGAITGKPVYDTKNDNIKNLHFAVYRSQVGMLPIVAFWAHAFMQRHWATKEDRQEAEQLYGYTLATEKYFEAKLLASCRRFGMSEQAFISEVEAQLARPLADATVSAGFRTASYVTADFGTFTANSIYYGQDERFANPLRSHPTGESDDFKGNGPVGLESWDITALTFMSRMNDCEDMGNVSTSGLRSLSYGRSDLEDDASVRNRALGTFVGSQWQSPLLRAAQRVLQQYTIMDVGGSVTAAYLGADGKKLEKKDIKELPMRGDAADRRNSTGGHAWGLMPPEARVALWLAKGGIADAPLGKPLSAYAKWQFALPLLVLEGTGPIEHLMLPAAECFGETSVDYCKAEAARALVRDTLGADDTFKPLTEAFRPYSVPFYTKKVEADRRITTFYREAVHGSSVDLYLKHHGLAQFTFVNWDSKERGVDLAKLARDGLDGNLAASTVALDAPFYAHARKWDEVMVPVMEAMVNQMPLTALGQAPLYQSNRPLQFTLMSQATLEQRLDIDALSVRTPLCYNVTSSKSVNAPYKADHAAALSPAAASAVNRMRDPATSPVKGSVSWNTVFDLLAWHTQHVGVGFADGTLAAHDPPPVEASIVDFRVPAGFDVHALTRANGVSWDALDACAHGVVALGKSQRFAIDGAATLVPDTRAPGAMKFLVPVAHLGHAHVPAPPNTLSLLRVGIGGRVFALAPIILVDQPLTAPAASYVQAVATDCSLQQWRLTVTLPSLEHVAQAFLTAERLTADPWLPLSAHTDSNNREALWVTARQANQLTRFDFGTPADAPVLSPFADCYKRPDVTLVRFFGHEWSLRKNREAALACIDRLYKSGVLVAHEFAVCSPLPQCDDVIELHMLIRVKAAAK
jgi:hypothetical protein